MLDNDKDEKNSEEMAAAAVMGLQMRYDKFYDFFMTSTMACVNDNCDVSCLNEVSHRNMFVLPKPDVYILY